MNNKVILHWNPNYSKFHLIGENNIVTLPYEYNELINYSINSCTFKCQNETITFLLPFLVKDWKIENILNRETKRIQITFNKIENDNVYLKIENYLKRISLTNKLDTQINVYDWNEKSNNRIVNISEQALIRIPSEFTHIKDCNYKYLIMTHYKSFINYVVIKWQVPIINIKQKIIQKKKFDLRSNFNNNKRIILNKSIIKGIEIDINLSINSFDNVNSFTNLTRNIVYKPILNK